MANCCCGQMRVVSKSKRAISRFAKIMNYKDKEFFCHRVRDFSEAVELRKKDGFWVADFYTESAWSSGNWFYQQDEPNRLIVKGFEQEEYTKPDGTKGKRDNFDKPIHGTAHITGLIHLAPLLGIGVELFATEPGFGFAEHATCDSKGNITYETRDYELEYPDEDMECEPVEKNGFGDGFMAFMEPEDIFMEED